MWFVIAYLHESITNLQKGLKAKCFCKGKQGGALVEVDSTFICRAGKLLL